MKDLYGVHAVTVDDIHQVFKPYQTFFEYAGKKVNAHTIIKAYDLQDDFAVTCQEKIMKIKSSYESPLVLDKVEIVESTFRKKDFTLEKLELHVYVEHTMKIVEENVYETALSTTVSDENENIYVNVKGRGIFHTCQKTWIHSKKQLQLYFLTLEATDLL